ncbi:glycosyltransferase family 2 protein [Roseitranquillus sediminis]|uniref:glycosyltransferase family 2 protein n=1 Tax=Roseitranquillus sediminis TaxID=2809051 RepID=UPI002223D90C|nr:glycosyltransferase family A protein [Roseitranquillus sediminis]MBM9594012.1 glycosyltransferase family 2 protein [Roseitranquillus sediminis]
MSVIIPTYNRREYLLECLESVAAQRVAPHEVIVVDDGSTDGTIEAVERMAGVTLIRQANAGPGAARNRGAAAASGDYLAFIDSDDLWFPWSLEAMAALVEQHRPSLIFARFEDFDGDRPPVAVAQPVEGRVFVDFLASAGQGCFAGAGMMVVDRARFLAAGGFTEDGMNAEDHDLALRLGEAPGFVQVAAPVTVAHRVHPGNEMGDLGKTLEGLARLVATERANGYPGGAGRRRARRTVIAWHVRPAVVAAIRSGQLRQALGLYLATFGWNLWAGRTAFLLGAPALCLGRMLSGRPAEPRHQ